MDTNYRFETAPRVDHEVETDANRASRSNAPVRPPQAQTVEFGNGWYHEAAIAADKGAFAHPYR
jgi:hypothetical protein